VATNGAWAGTPATEDVGLNAFKIRVADRFGLFDEAMLILGRTNLVVSTVADTGPGSLRDAITAANAQFGPDTITFNISGGGMHTIAPLTPLPAITDPVVIDGYSQPGAAGGQLGASNRPVILVQLTGTNITSSADGLALMTSNSVIRGLAVNLFRSRGICLTGGATSNRIEGNFIGTDPAGMVSLTNGVGVEINWGPGNIVGGNGPSAGNLISGNFNEGLALRSASSTNNLVQGNFLGLSVTGTNALGNGNDGLRIECPFSLFLSNVISGNRANGVRAWGANGHHNRLEGNRVGTDVTGRSAVSNTLGGVVLYLSPSNTVGGTSAAARNLISGNGGIGLNFSGATNSVALGNFIGVDATGSNALGNSSDGVSIGASECILGGFAAGAGNVISGNGRDGCSIQGFRNRVLANFIGLDAVGTDAVPNKRYGVVISGTTADNQIGGISEGEGNRIAFNQANGVVIGYLVTATTTNNTIRGNAIFANGGLGIDLANNGVTTNHVGGPATGPNLWQAHPVLSAAILRGGTTIQGALSSQANQTFELDFYANDAPDDSSYGQGQIYLGTKAAATDDLGNLTFSFTPLGGAALGKWIAATATDPFGNTSEFSRAVQVTAPPQFAPNRVCVNNGTFSAQVTGLPPNVRVVLQASVNLQDWVPVTTNLVVQGVVNFTDSVATNFPVRFYRAWLLP